jgi:lipopolysaccharide export system protein LptA
MSRPLRIGISFVAVLVAYWAYALLAVPLIEPEVNRQKENDRFERDRLAARQEMNRRLTELEGLFPPGSWALENAKILQSEQVRLLIRDYTNLGDGKVEIRPCAMVYTPEGPPQTEAERKRQSVILEAPEGAVLQFDQPFDLSRAKIGRLINGRLKGQITIRSDSKYPGPDDDLLVRTREVEITEQYVSTPYEVEFRYGPNHGQGRQMLIKLLPGEPGAADQRGPNIGGVELFEIKQLERLHLDFGSRGMLANRSSMMPTRPDEASLPVEVACRGPFRFKPLEQVITFEDRVDLLRLHPDGPSDQLNCELLSIFLARTRNPAPAQSGNQGKTPGMLDLQPRRIEARGRPVVVRAPSQAVDARGERLEYDIPSARIVLDGQQEVVLRQATNEIHARSLQYQSGGPGRLGQVAAQGPGWLRGEMKERFSQPLEARWNDQLRVRPYEQQQVISLTGGAELIYGAMGRLAAHEIHFWLFELPPAPGAQQSQIRPDRMLARQQVRLGATQLSGAVDQFEVWFDQQPAAPTAPVQPGQAGPPALGGQSTVSASPAKNVPTAQAASAAQPGQVAGGNGPLASGVPQPPSAPAQHFHVLGNLLRCRVAMRGEQAELSKLMVDGQVRCQETQTTQPNEQPLLIVGDRIQVLDVSQPHATVTITGAPAHFEYRGLGLTGTNINLNRGTNRLWIDGAGRMDLVVDRDLEGRPMSQPGNLTIDWQQQMTFDGRTAHFQETVVATGQHQQLRTESLDVSLQQTIRFDKPDQRQQPQLAQIRCNGGVLMEGETLDEHGRASNDKLQVLDLTANLINGDVRANGPGWMTTVRRETGNPLANAAGLPGSAPPADPPPETADADKTQLVFLNVRFQGAILGNMRRREMAFHEQVKTVYGPVATWEGTLDADNPDGLGAEGFLLTCDRLAVTQMPVPTGEGYAVELEATGNTLVENRTFTARAARMTYTKAKNLLILEGDGRIDAELSGQKYVGGPVSHAAARKILYGTETKRLSVDGVRWLELNEFPALNARSK